MRYQWLYRLGPGESRPVTNGLPITASGSSPLMTWTTRPGRTIRRFAKAEIIVGHPSRPAGGGRQADAVRRQRSVR